MPERIESRLVLVVDGTRGFRARTTCFLSFGFTGRGLERKHYSLNARHAAFVQRRCSDVKNNSPPGHKDTKNGLSFCSLQFRLRRASEQEHDN